MSLLYLWVALSSAGILGFVTVLDKRLASYNMPSLPAFYAGYPSPSGLRYHRLGRHRNSLRRVNKGAGLRGSFRPVLGRRAGDDVLGL